MTCRGSPVVLETCGGLSTEGMTLFKTVLGVLPVVWRHTVQDRSRPCAMSQLQLTALRGECDPGKDTEV